MPAKSRMAHPFLSAELCRANWKQCETKSVFISCNQDEDAWNPGLGSEELKPMSMDIFFFSCSLLRRRSSPCVPWIIICAQQMPACLLKTDPPPCVWPCGHTQKQEGTNLWLFKPVESTLRIFGSVTLFGNVHENCICFWWVLFHFFRKTGIPINVPAQSKSQFLFVVLSDSKGKFQKTTCFNTQKFHVALYPYLFTDKSNLLFTELGREKSSARQKRSFCIDRTLRWEDKGN